MNNNQNKKKLSLIKVNKEKEQSQQNCITKLTIFKNSPFSHFYVFEISHWINSSLTYQNLSFFSR